SALQLATDAGDNEMIAKTLVNRSEVLIARDALAEALDHCDRALQIYAEVGDEIGRGEALRWRAHAQSRAGQVSEAERSAAEAFQIAVRAGTRLLEAESARDLGVLRGMLGDRAGASRLLRRALTLFVDLGARREAADVEALLARATPAGSLDAIDLDMES
ncbi:MAG TPA: hypothetical protein VGG84_03695, partial [Gemmatimonadaceae bacterium]